MKRREKGKITTAPSCPGCTGPKKKNGGLYPYTVVGRKKERVGKTRPRKKEKEHATCNFGGRALRNSPAVLFLSSGKKRENRGGKGKEPKERGKGEFRRDDAQRRH